MNRWANNYYGREGQPAGAERKVVEKRPRRQAHDAAAITSAHNRRRRSSQLKALGTEVSHLWVFRVVHLTRVTLKSFIERQGVQVLDIQQVSHKEAAYKSFLVTVNEADAPTLLYRTFWPGLVSCKMWYERGDARRASIFSRRSARGAHVATLTNDGEAAGGVREERRNQTLDPSRRQPLPDPAHPPTHTTLTHHLPNLQTNDNIKVRKDKENIKGNVKDLRKDKNVHVKKGNIRENNKRVRPGSRRNSTSEKRDKNVKNKGDKLNVGKKKVTKNTGKRKDKRTVDKERGDGRNTDLGKDNLDAVDHTKETFVVRNKDKENMGGTMGYRKSFKDSKRHIVDKSRLQENMNDGNKKITTKVEKTGRQNRQIDKDKERRHVIEIYQSPTGQRNKGQPRNQAPDPPTLSRTHGTSNYAATGDDNLEMEVKQPNWVLSLSKLLILSSEEVVARLLSSEYDDLLTQDHVSDDELFLGVKVLAHSVRSSRSEPDDLPRLVHKILQPHVISLIKTFSVTVEMQYPERAERYFWDLAKFLDLYIVKEMDIDGMPNLFSTCLSEVLALSYRSYVSADLVQVYRGMHEWVSRSAGEREQVGQGKYR